MRYDELISLE